MQIVGAVLSFLLFCGFAFPGIVSACTLDSNGQGVAINCTKKPFMESHTVYADGKSTIRFHGQCYYSQGENAWNKHYYINAYWDGTQARESVTISGENKTGTVISTCPSNPWLNNVVCQKKSFSGSAFGDYQITGATQYPLTGKALNDAEKAQLRTEVEKKKQEAACANPVLVSPAASGGHFAIPATIKIEVRHNPSNPPKEWTFTWAPTPKQGEWPTAPVAQSVTLSNLKTVNGVTTGTFNTSKVGEWRIQWKVNLPPYCNKGPYAAMSTSFSVREKSKGEAMSDKMLKDKAHTAPGMKVNTGKPMPDPVDQQKLRQQTTTVTPQQTQQTGPGTQQKVLQPNLQQQQKLPQQQKQQMGQ